METMAFVSMSAGRGTEMDGRFGRMTVTGVPLTIAAWPTAPTRSGFNHHCAVLCCVGRVYGNLARAQPAGLSCSLPSGLPPGRLRGRGNRLRAGLTGVPTAYPGDDAVPGGSTGLARSTGHGPCM